MKNYKFIHKAEKNRLTLLAVICGLDVFFLNTNYNSFIKIIIFWVIAIPTFISLFNYIKLTKKKIDNLILDGKLIKLYFWNSDSKPIHMNKSEIQVNEAEDKLTLIDKKDSKVLGYAFKKSIEDSNQWSELLIDLKD